MPRNDVLRLDSVGVDIPSRTFFFAAITQELARAYEKHGAPPWTKHEFYAILREEFDELWDAIKPTSRSSRSFAKWSRLPRCACGSTRPVPHSENWSAPTRRVPGRSVPDVRKEQPEVGQRWRTRTGFVARVYHRTVQYVALEFEDDGSKVWVRIGEFREYYRRVEDSANA